MYRPVNLAFSCQWIFLYTHVVAPHFIGIVPAPVSSPNSIPLWNQKVKEGGMACRETFQLKRESPREKGPFLVSRVRINSYMHLTHMLLTRLFERSFPTPSVALPSGVGSLFSFQIKYVAQEARFKKKKWNAWGGDLYVKSLLPTMQTM